MFEGNLTAGELLAVRRAGYEPIKLGLGVTVFSFNAQIAATGQYTYNSIEQPYLTQALGQARSLALSRLYDEAARMGAEVVVGVRIAVRDFGEGLMEFSALGTGIRRTDKPPGRPALTALSGSEFLKLRAAGYDPVGVAFGLSVYLQISLETWTNMYGPNQTWGGMMTGVRPDLSALLNDARERAFTNLLDEARKLNCDGVIGTVAQERRCSFAPQIVEFFVVGTAVRQGYFEDRPIELGISLRDLA